MVVMIAAGQGAMPLIGLLKYVNKTRQRTRSAQGSWRCREEGPLTWVLYETLIKQGFSAGSIGQASKESRLEALAEQARSLNRIHRLSNEQELGFGSFLFWIFLSYQVKIQQYVGTRMQ
jgi:hypothetical protein